MALIEEQGKVTRSTEGNYWCTERMIRSVNMPWADDFEFSVDDDYPGLVVSINSEYAVNIPLDDAIAMTEEILAALKAQKAAQ